MKQEQLNIGQYYIVKSGMALEQEDILQLVNIKLKQISPDRIVYTFKPLGSELYTVEKWDTDIMEEVRKL